MLELEKRFVAMGMRLLGMQNLNDVPETNNHPKEDSPGILKKIYLHRISNMIYENYVSEANTGTDLMKAILVEQRLLYADANLWMKMEGIHVAVQTVVKRMQKMERKEKIMRLLMYRQFMSKSKSLLPLYQLHRLVKIRSTTSASLGLAFFVWRFMMPSSTP